MLAAILKTIAIDYRMYRDNISSNIQPHSLQHTYEKEKHLYTYLRLYINFIAHLLIYL